MNKQPIGHPVVSDTSAALRTALIGARVGDLLSIPSGILVQGCNSLGVMGAGLAKEIAQKHPDVLRDYRSVFQSTGLRLGQVVWSEPTAARPFWIANAITQERIGRRPGERYADIDAIVESFRAVIARAQERGLMVHYPLVGAGLGGLPWTEVHARLAPLWGAVPHQLWIHPNNPWAPLVGRASGVAPTPSRPSPPVTEQPASASASGFTGRWRRSPH